MIGQSSVLNDYAAGQMPTGQDVSAFSSWWQQFTQIWPAFLQLDREIQDHQNQWSVLATAAYRAGDLEGFRAAKARATELDKLEGQRATVADTVTKFKDAWEGFRSWIANAGVWAGSGTDFTGIGAPLGIAPLLLVVGIPAMIGAIAWVVNTYFTLRADLDFDTTLLNGVAAGRLTPAQARGMQRGGSGLTLTGSLGLLAAGLLALAILPGLLRSR